MPETTAILRSLLYHIEKAKTVKEAIAAVKVMCTKDDIAAVEQQIADEQNESEETG